MDTRSIDVAVIGGGQAGIPLAFRLANAGRSVVLFEKHFLGGSCVNFGCTPTKAAIASARVAQLARRGAEFGLRIPTVEVDFPAVLAGARATVLESRSGLDGKFKAGGNPGLIREHARFAGREGDRFRLEAGPHSLLASEVVINTGTRSVVPPIPGLEDVTHITAENWLDQSSLPTDLAILGGGYIAVEMAQFYQRMGSRVTIFERGSHLLSHEDEDISEAIMETLGNDGVRVRCGTQVASVKDFGGAAIFIATGRRANTDDLGLDTVGVKMDEHGNLEVDERLATSIPGIWAAGDVRGGPLFTHTSWDDYRILDSQMTGDGRRTTRRIVPYGVFVDPELGRVGMTEREAARAGRKYRVSRFEMKRNGKAREVREPNGFIKVLLEEETDQILGAAVLSTEGAELVHIFIDLMNAGAPFTRLRDAVHIHPTLAEAVQSAVS